MELTMPSLAKKLRTISSETNCGTAMATIKQVLQNFCPLVFLLLMSRASAMPSHSTGTSSHRFSFLLFRFMEVVV